jgi:hypothetical protein
VCDRFLDLKIDLQPVTESDLFDLQISLQERDLFVNRAEGPIVMSQDVPKDLGQSDDHFFGRSWLGDDQGCDTV